LTNGINLRAAPLRHAATRDVVIDSVCALLAQVLVWWWATNKETAFRATAASPSGRAKTIGGVCFRD